MMKSLLDDSQLIDVGWVLICGTLVFFMQAGFACLESGLTRKKNSINVALKKIAGFSITGSTFWLYGFTMIFGLSSYYGFVGHMNRDLSSTHVGNVVLYFYQLMFAACAITIISGAVAERVKFSGYLIMVFLMATLVYPFVGHWIWSFDINHAPQGFLNKMGFIDFAGSTVVHSAAGWAALMCVIVLGPRIGRFSQDGKAIEISGNDVPLSILGAFILWVGWLGFNGGSALVLNARVPTILLCTMTAGIFGLLSCFFVDWYRKGYARVDSAINGALGGLVGVTASSNVIEVSGAIFIGLISGIIVLAAEELLVKLKWDDAVGAFPVHGACGVFGTLAVAFFGDPQFFEGKTALEQFKIQLVGCFVVFVWTSTVMFLSIKIIDKFFYKLRVSGEEEEKGLNIIEHRATTEILDLFYAMEKQAKTGDLSSRIYEEPFTEAGQIARRYNKVLDRVNIEMEISNRMVKLAEIAKQETEDAKERLKEKVNELEKFNHISVGREIRMIELKKEINKLCEALGRPPKFDLDKLNETLK